MNKRIATFVFFILSFSLYGQTTVYVTHEDSVLFERFLSQARTVNTLPIGDLIIKTARFFLGTPYIASTLEKEPEGLVINMREMDCTTYMENVLALSQTLQDRETSFSLFCRNLQRLRYRSDTPGYTDRLHYMTDWIYENERKGLVKDVSKEIGGIVLPLKLSFISTHPDSYRQLKNHPEWITRIAAKEKEINARTYYYIPKANFEHYADNIQSGDIICFTTTLKGLDVTHVGIAYRTESGLTFLHASSSQKKVVINEQPLAEYLKAMKSCTGLLIARPQAQASFK